jgi:hypothetical protein
MSALIKDWDSFNFVHTTSFSLPVQCAALCASNLWMIMIRFKKVILTHMVFLILAPSTQLFIRNGVYMQLSRYTISRY